MILEGKFAKKNSEEKKSNLLSKVETRVQEKFRNSSHQSDMSTVEVDALSQFKANINHLTELQAKSRFMVREINSLTTRS